MKKTLITLVAVVMMVLLTGCEAKEEVLTCTLKQEQTGMVMNQEIEAEFVNNEVVDMSMDIDVNLDDTYAPYIDTMKTTFEEQFKTYSDNGAKVEVTSEGNVVEIDIDFDLKNMSLEQKKNLDMLDVYGTKAATQEELEKQGYTCR